MAICNLFNELTDASGNFLMFSQYVEDITHNLVDSDAWKIVPTRFLAFDIDYSKLKSAPKHEEVEEPDSNTDIPESEPESTPKSTPEEVEESDSNTLNTDIPKFFQNYFENGCAYRPYS